MVKELFHASAEERRARLVSVLGAAGLGKSRLGWEFDKYIDGLASTVWWHRGRCLSYGDGIAFWALAEIFRQRLGIAETDSPEVAAGKLADALPEWVPDAQERAFITPRVAVLVGASSLELGREELFAGWRLFLERLAERHPVVLVIENLQWADSGLLDFLEYLLEWSHDSALFILTLARPDLVEKRPGWLAAHRDSLSLNLGPLPDALLAEVLHGLVPNLPAPVSQAIIARAQGVPLYAVELVRSLVDRGVVTIRGGVHTVIAEIGDLDVPDTLTSLISARLDRLPAAERRLVKDLAVLGDSFLASSVAAISDATVGQVNELLRALTSKQILTVRSDPLSPDRGQYTFVQTLLRSVAHSMLTKRERKTRHLAVAAHLQAGNPDGAEDIAEVIAAHYLTAYHASAPAEQDDLREQTVQALSRAGYRAGQVGSPDTAETHYRAAAELATIEEQKATLLASAGDMARQAGRLVDAQKLYETAADLHTTAGRPDQAATLAASIGYCKSLTGNLELAITGMRSALPILESGGFEAQLAEFHAELATDLFFAGHSDEVLHHTEQALRLAADLDLPEILTRSLRVKSILLTKLGRNDEGLAGLEAAVKIALDRGMIREEMVGRQNLADIRKDLDLPGCLDQFEIALGLAQRVGDRRLEAEVLVALAGAHLWVG
ncbi:MAG: AAA family ATPase, partial [Gemmatimonadota bacterium]|nr:AAA family ATPase [Gemmatimonadota bacterium]